MHERVGDEVRHDLAQALLVTGHDDVAGDGPVDGTIGLDRTTVAGGVGDDGGEVDSLARHRSPLVQPGEVEQVLHERAHADRLLLRPPHRLRQLGRLRQRAGAVELGVAADRRDRRAELVRRVTHELPETILHALALVEHLVQRGGEVARLGAGRHVGRHARCGVASSDRSRHRGHALHRSDAEADHPPREHAEHGECGDGRHRLDDDQAAHGGVDVAERQRVDDRRPGLAPGDGAVAHVGVLARHGERLTEHDGPFLDDRQRRVDADEVRLVQRLDGVAVVVADVQRRRPRLAGSTDRTLASRHARQRELLVDLRHEVALGRARDDRGGAGEHEREHGHRHEEAAAEAHGSRIE